LVIFPGLTIRFFLGENWLEAIPLVRPLIIAGLIQSIVSIASAVFMAQKTYRWLNTNLLVTAISMCILIPFMGTRYDVLGAVIAVLISRVIGLPFALYGIVETLKTQPRQSYWQR
jgi:O-antigen/teichoic acid export membrane protein